MKIALYIEDGLEQIVLTPETKTESSILQKMSDAVKSEQRQMSIHRGSFYGCQGGWMRHRQQYGNLYGRNDDDESTIIVLENRPQATTEYEGPMEPDIP